MSPTRKVRKAVMPVAGLGTRFLPASKAQPKEMLPLVDKPIIQYTVEEAVASGRLAYDVQPAWGSERAALWDMFKIAVDSGHLPKLPNENVIYSP